MQVAGTARRAEARGICARHSRREPGRRSRRFRRWKRNKKVEALRDHVTFCDARPTEALAEAEMTSEETLAVSSVVR